VARISSIQEAEHPELADLITKIRGGRGGRLLNLYRMLLHSPDVAASWYEHVGAVRWKTELDGQLREIIIIRIAILNRVDYVLKAHVPAYTEPEGMSQEQCDAIADWEDSALFTPAQKAVLAYVDAMTLHVQVPDEVYSAVRRHFTERQTVEITVLIGVYNMHTRVLGALEVDPEPPAVKA
jgi:4-carboxymuconolactone decarboxylase